MLVQWVWIDLAGPGACLFGHNPLHGPARNPLGLAVPAQYARGHGKRELDEAAIAPGVGHGETVPGRNPLRKAGDPHVEGHEERLVSLTTNGVRDAGWGGV